MNQNGGIFLTNFHPQTKERERKERWRERKEGKNENPWEESNWISWNDEYEKESKDGRGMRRKREEGTLQNERIKLKNLLRKFYQEGVDGKKRRIFVTIGSKKKEA